MFCWAVAFEKVIVSRGLATDRMIQLKQKTYISRCVISKFKKYLGLVNYLNFSGERDQV